MTGAGSASVAYTLEDSFLGGVGSSPTYVQPGSNIAVETASLDNFLTRIRRPDARESIRSVAGRVEGGLTVSFNLGPGASANRSDFHDLVFNDTDGSGNDTFSAGLVPSAEWYLGTDFESGGSLSTAERVAKGWACVQATVDYAEGDVVRVTLDGIYGDEQKNASLTPGSIARPGAEADFHETDLTLDATTQAKLQSATLTFDDLARFERGTSRQPIAAVAGPANVSLDAAAILTEVDQLELAYGASGVSSVQDSVGGVSGSFTISPNGTAAADYQLSGLTPATYEWSDLVAADTSLTEPITFQTNGVTQNA